MIDLIIFIPRIDSTGPIKGALAIAKLLSKEYKITVISIKNNNQINLLKFPNIDFISLQNAGNYLHKILLLRKIIKNIKLTNKKTLMLSLCFSADFTSLFTQDLLPRISSVRGNLIANYFFSYGFWGYFLAFFHLSILRFSKNVIVMNKLMQNQVKLFTNKKSIIIPNFIDEEELSTNIC